MAPPPFTALSLQDSGEELWSYTGDTPFFSSPSAGPGGVVIGSVDGRVCCLSPTGALVSPAHTSLFDAVLSETMAF